MILKQRNNMEISKKKIPPAQEKRVEYIERLVYFQGEVNRADIQNKFNISAAASTKDLSKYNQMAPKNLIYNVRRKCYEISEAFVPVYIIDPIIDRFPGYTIPKLHQPADEEAIEKVALISRAIHRIQALKITYSSVASGVTSRKIVPVAFANNLLRWHLRAYDREREKYIDFVVSRIKKVEGIEEEIQPHEHPKNDSQWHSHIELRIKPHPHNLVDSQQFEISDKGHLVDIRAAMAGHFLALYNVDCSPDSSLIGKQYQYILSNLEEISRLTNLELAPGYNNHV